MPALTFSKATTPRKRVQIMAKQENLLPVNAFYLTCLRDKRSKNRPPATWTDKKTGEVKEIRTYLNSTDLLIYMMLLTRADKNLECYPSIETICADCGGLDRRLVWKHLVQLEQMQMINIEKSKGRPNRYYMTDFAEWLKNPGY